MRAAQELAREAADEIAAAAVARRKLWDGNRFALDTGVR